MNFRPKLQQMGALWNTGEMPDGSWLEKKDLKKSNRERIDEFVTLVSCLQADCLWTSSGQGL